VFFVIAYYFAVIDIPVLQDVSEFGEETCGGAEDVLNALE
jgi:hypothetical protein